jgi:multidrug resistance efflux pump
MEEPNKKTETTGVATPEPVVPPLKKKRKRKLLVIGVVRLVVLIAVVIYYIHFIAPYESTDDAFIDGYVTIVSSRVPDQVERLPKRKINARRTT